MKAIDKYLGCWLNLYEQASDEFKLTISIPMKNNDNVLSGFIMQINVQNYFLFRNKYKRNESKRKIYLTYTI